MTNKLAEGRVGVVLKSVGEEIFKIKAKTFEIFKIYSNHLPM